MKKLLILAFAAVQMFAAGTVTQTITQIGATGTFAMEWRWTGDASTGSVPVSTAASLRSQQFQGMLLVGAEFIPGSTAPTTLYDVTITDDGGYDILAGAGANLSATAASTALVSASATPLNGALTMTLTNNSVASATGRVVLYMQRQNTATINGFYGGVPLAKLSTAGATVGDAIVLGANGRWGPGAGGGGGAVSSVFGRTGAVAATGGDYTASQVTNVPAGGIAATNVQAAITELDTEKQATGNYITALTGDGTASGPGSAALTLATVNSNTGACGDSTHVCQLTLNGKGLATAATPVAITGGGTGTVTVVGSGSLTSTALVTGGGTTTVQTPSSLATLDTSGNLAVTSVSTGTSAPTCTAGTAGLICLKEGTAGTGEASAALLYSKTDHLLYANLNNGGEVQVPTATSTATLTNKTLTAPVISTISNTGTLTLPTSTDTLVGKATTDTFTNKTFDTAGTGNSFKINGTTVSSVAGNTSKVQLAGAGSPATNDCAKFDANGNIVTAGSACGSGGGAVSCPSSSSAGGAPYGPFAPYGYGGGSQAGLMISDNIVIGVRFTAPCTGTFTRLCIRVATDPGASKSVVVGIGDGTTAAVISGVQGRKTASFGTGWQCATLGTAFSATAGTDYYYLTATEDNATYAPWWVDTSGTSADLPALLDNAGDNRLIYCTGASTSGTNTTYALTGTCTINTWNVGSPVVPVFTLLP